MIRIKLTECLVLAVTWLLSNHEIAARPHIVLAIGASHRFVSRQLSTIS